MITELETKTTNMMAVVAEMGRISTKVEFDKAGQWLRDVVALKDEIKATFDPIVKQTNDAHKEAISQRKKHLVVPEGLERALKARRGEYVQLQERAAEEERRRIEKEAREKAAVLQAKLDAEALAKAEDEALERAAVFLAEGEIEKADEAIEAPIEVAPVAPVVAPIVPRAVIPEQKGFRDNWEYAITDERALKLWIWKTYPGLLKIDEAGMRVVVKELKAEARGIPGIEVTCRKIESVRR